MNAMIVLPFDRRLCGQDQDKDPSGRVMSQDGAPHTVTCRYFLSNACRLGNECQFSHERTASRPDNTCKFYLAGKCSFGNHCRYDHVRNHNKRGKDPPQSAGDVKSSTTPSRGVKSQTNPGPGSSRNSSDEPSEKKTSSGLNVNAPEFIPGFLSPNPATISSYAGAVRGGDSEFLELDDEGSILCPYHIMGHCYYGDNCTYLHGDPCDLCMKPLLHPNRPQQNLEHRRECMAAYEQEMEESFAMARSRDQACGICMEVVLEKKELSDRRFGILQNCKHVYCLDCIRKWRLQNKSGSIEKEVVRTCPQCRVPSDFVTPSSIWVEDEEEKKAIIDSYKTGMKTKNCKYFKAGNAECPFGNRCFYKHAKPDGTIVEGDSPRTVRRRMLQAARQERRRHPDTFVMWEFMQRHLGDGIWSDPEDDDDDFWEFDHAHGDLFADASWDEFTIGSDDSDGEHPWLLEALREELDFLTFSPLTSDRRSRPNLRNPPTDGSSTAARRGSDNSTGQEPSSSHSARMASHHSFPGGSQTGWSTFMEGELAREVGGRGGGDRTRQDFSSSDDSWYN